MDLFGISLSGAMDLVFFVLIFVFLAMFVFGIIFFFYWMSKYNIRVRVIDETGEMNVVYEDKCRVLKKDGEIKWQFLKTKNSMNKRLRVERPAKEFIDLNKKGKKIATAKLVGDGDIIFVNNRIDSDFFKKYTEKITDEGAWRNSFISEQRRGRNRYEQKDLGYWIQTLMPIIIIFVCVIGVVIVVDSVTKTQSEVGKQQTSMTASNKEISENLLKISENLNRVMNRLDIKDINSTEVPN